MDPEAGKSLGSSPDAIERERPTAEVKYFGDRDNFVVLGNDLAPEEWNRDWTRSFDEDVWRSRNSLRYNMMREALYQGNTVQIKSGGKSLDPLVWSGDTCFF